MTEPDDFFTEPREHSQTKARIVSKYMQGWARILTDFQRSKGVEPDVAIIDLFSGPGSYDDGTASTPILTLKHAIEDIKLSSSLRTYFNDHNLDNCASLAVEIRQLPGLEILRHNPMVISEDATVDTLKRFSVPASIPKLYFLDPFGYKQISVSLLKACLSDWSECIFFFNYRRIIAAVTNPAMNQNMLTLFGATALSELRTQLTNVSDVLTRERTVLECLKKALDQIGGKFFLSFAFKVADDQRSTHHLIFAGGHQKGYDLMKMIMAGESSESRFGVPSMGYTQRPTTGNMFQPDPLEELGADLLERFCGQTLSVSEIYKQHSPASNFVLPNYRTILQRLEARGVVTATPPADQRPRTKDQSTLSATTRITFTQGVK